MNNIATPYHYAPAPLFLSDAPRKQFYNLDYHLKTGDYLGVIATALGSVIDDYAKRNDAQSVKHELLLRKIQGDLAKLHKTHAIVQK